MVVSFSKKKILFGKKIVSEYFAEEIGVDGRYEEVTLGRGMRGGLGGCDIGVFG